MMWINWVVQAERSIEELNTISLPEYFLFMAGQAHSSKTLKEGNKESAGAEEGEVEVSSNDDLNKIMGPVMRKKL